jgi:hypothetical protein
MKTQPSPNWVKRDARKYPGGPAPDPLKPQRRTFLGREASATINVREEDGFLEFTSKASKIPPRLAENIRNMPRSMIELFRRRPGTYTLADMDRVLSGLVGGGR